MTTPNPPRRPHVKVDPAQVELTQLAVELGHALQLDGDELTSLDDAVTADQLQAAVKAHRPRPVPVTPNPRTVALAELRGAQTVTQLRDALLSLLDPDRPTAPGRPL